MYVFLLDVVFGSKRFAIDGLAFLSQNPREPPLCPIYRWLSRGLEWAHEKPGAGQGREVWTVHTGPRFLQQNRLFDAQAQTPQGAEGVQRPVFYAPHSPSQSVPTLQFKTNENHCRDRSYHMAGTSGAFCKTTAHPGFGSGI